MSETFNKELRTLFQLAWPLLIAQVTQTLMGVSDTIMAGRYSSVDMAAVAIGVSISLPMLIFIQGICLALPPVISRLDGGKKHHEVAQNVQQMLYLSLSIALIMLIFYFFLPHVVLMIDMTEEMSKKSLDYLFYVFMAAPGFALYQTLRNYCEGLSLTRPTMFIMGGGLLVNIPANYILINGLFGLPELGGAGCGLATMLVFYFMAFATFIYTLKSQKLRTTTLYFHWHKPNFPLIGGFLKLGLPIACTLLFEVSLFAMVAVLLAPFGALTVAAHQIALNVSSLIFMLPLSIGLALAIRIGFLVGEQRSVDTKISFAVAMLMAVSTVFVTASMTVLFNHEIAHIYSNEVALINAAASLLILASLFQLSDAIQVLSANALRGYKDTQAMFLLSFVSYWLVGFPVGITLGLTDIIVPKMSAAGFWIGFIIGLSTAAILMGWRVKVIQNRLIN